MRIYLSVLKYFLAVYDRTVTTTNAANCTEHFMNSEFMLLFSFVLLFCHVFS